MCHVVKVSGPPGTGKTTTIIDTIKVALGKGIAPEEIAFVSLTNKSINVALERVKKTFGEEIANRCINFKTLHSFTTTAAKQSKYRISSIEDYAELLAFLKSMGFLQKVRDLAWVDPEDGKAKRAWQLESMQFHKTIETDFRTGYFKYVEDRGWKEDEKYFDYVKRIKSLVDTWKEAKLVAEFEDVIANFNEYGHEECDQFEVVFVDEAQDLTPDQWTTIERLKEKCNHLYIFGDVNQSIYRFAGVDTQRYLGFEADEEHGLAKTWRFGDKIRDKALGHLGDYNLDKREYAGAAEIRSYVHGHMNGEKLDKQIARYEALGKTVMILAPTRFQLPHIDKERKLISTSTIHKAKGGEWDVVVFINSFGKNWANTPKDEIERIRYVARTRARRVLIEQY